MSLSKSIIDKKQREKKITPIKIKLSLDQHFLGTDQPSLYISERDITLIIARLLPLLPKYNKKGSIGIKIQKKIVNFLCSLMENFLFQS